MLRGREIIGMPVISIPQAEPITKVRDVIFDAPAGVLAALLVDEGGWVSGATILPFDAVSSIGRDAVMVEDVDRLIASAERPELDKLLTAGQTLIGNTMYTVSGDKIGVIDDIVVDEESGQIVGYDVSGGLFKDFYRGKFMVEVPEIVSVGPEVVIVPDDVERAVEEKVGGLRGFYDEQVVAAQEAVARRERDFALGRTTGRDVLGDNGAVLIERGTLVTDEDVERAEEAGRLHQLAIATGWGEAQRRYVQAHERVTQFTGDQVRGRVAGRDVPDDNGNILVEAGQTINDNIIARAQENGLMTDLALAAGRAAAAAAYGAARDKVQAGYEQVRPNRKAVAEGEELADRAQVRLGPADESRARSLIGKTASLTVTDEGGLPIVEADSKVTAESVDRALAAGKLEELEQSVGVEQTSGSQA